MKNGVFTCGVSYSLRKLLHRMMTGVLIMAFTVAGMMLEGCGRNAEREETVRKALIDKYGEEFEVTHIYGQGIMTDYFTAEAYATAYPDLPFSLNMDINDGTFMDGYVMKRGTNLISVNAQKNLGHLKNPYYLHTQSMFPDSVSMDPDLSLEEYLATEKTNFFTLYLYMDPNGETPESIYQSVNGILKGMEAMQGSLEIFFADEATMDRARDYVESHAGLEEEYAKIGRKIHVIGIKFENDGLDISQDAFLSKIRSKM
ncbi:MAG: hypothetical protein Q4F43_04855 [Eubacteriales bacterium]|nr:hypothetical protein [Eubacteriales bacterium]